MGSRGARVCFGSLVEKLVKDLEFDHGQYRVKMTSFRYFECANRFVASFMIEMYIWFVSERFQMSFGF